jgi:hypothetical protein
VTQLGWGVLMLAVIALLFAGLFWLSFRIEPDDKDTRNDEWLRKRPPDSH